jgi:hypothetical protein
MHKHTRTQINRLARYGAKGANRKQRRANAATVAKLTRAKVRQNESATD